MKKNVSFLLICLLFLACSKEENDFSQNIETVTPSLVADELLWGTWSFSYVTNTMEGTRSYTFNQDGNYSYLDEWTVHDVEWNVVSQDQDKKNGTYMVTTYTKKGSNSAEGEIVIGKKKMPFSISNGTTGNILLFLDNVESYTKQFSAQ
jgi:hypothetical protein